MAELFLFPPAAPKVTPANVSGGGGSRSELVITWEVSKPAQEPASPMDEAARCHYSLWVQAPVSLITRERPNVWCFIFKNTEAITAAVTPQGREKCF